jgi:hypothetical protein
MKTRRFGVATKVHQVVLEDIEAWHQQLYEELHCICHYDVFDPPAHWGIRSAVTLRVLRQGMGEHGKEMWTDYVVISRTETGAIEAAMLQLASKALLELQQEVERRERQAPLFVA